MGFSRQEYWSGQPFSFPEDLPDPGIESGSLDRDQLPGLLSNMLLSAIPLMELGRSVVDLEVSRSLERVFGWQLFFRSLVLFRRDL